MRLVRGATETDAEGVADYCECLADALSERGHQVSVCVVDWHRMGRARATRDLLSPASGAPPAWTILQHTHLSWSRRGFPLFAVLIALILKRKTMRLAAVIHDPLPFAGTRVRDRLRRRAQVWVMRRLVRICDVTFVTVPLEVIPWVRRSTSSVRYIPVGSNIRCTPSDVGERSETFEVVVFGVSMNQQGELFEIVRVTTELVDTIGRVRLSVVGRGSDRAVALLSELSASLDVEIETTGILPPSELGIRLARADALLFVRAGGISSRRGTAIAALAAGLPVVGYEGPETGPPLTEAGVLLAPPGDAAAAARALAEVARDPAVARRLRRRSVGAHRRHFAWPVIAERLERALQDS